MRYQLQCFCRCRSWRAACSGPRVRTHRLTGTAIGGIGTELYMKRSICEDFDEYIRGNSKVAAYKNDVIN